MSSGKASHDPRFDKGTDYMWSESSDPYWLPQHGMGSVHDATTDLYGVGANHHPTVNHLAAFMSPPRARERRKKPGEWRRKAPQDDDQNRGVSQRQAPHQQAQREQPGAAVGQDRPVPSYQQHMPDTTPEQFGPVTFPQSYARERLSDGQYRRSGSVGSPEPATRRQGGKVEPGRSSHGSPGVRPSSDRRRSTRGSRHGDGRREADESTGQGRQYNPGFPYPTVESPYEEAFLPPPWSSESSLSPA